MDLMIAFQAVGKEGDGDSREGMRHRHRVVEETGYQKEKCTFTLSFDGQIG